MGRGWQADKEGGIGRSVQLAEEEFGAEVLGGWNFREFPFGSKSSLK